ncbi:phage minor head protein [Tissierella praeacuta]|uniref:phage minor head protein n=1 Tax=Tissierella praeacuta TaxID=43131 RepID=UPI003DA341C9
MKLDKEFLKLQKEVDRLIKTGEKDIARNYKKSLNQLRLYVAELYEKYSIAGQLTFYELSKYNRLSKMDKELIKIVSELYKGNNQAIRGTLKGIVEDTYTNTLDIINNATGRRIKGIIKPIDVTKSINSEMAGLKWTERMNYHRNTAIYEIQKEIKQGLTQGDTYSTMAKRLKKKLETDINKTNTIVKTEGHRVHAQAKVDSLDDIVKQGVRMTKTWVTSKDERVRGQKPSDTMNHVDMDGVTIPYEEDFILPDGSQGKAPGLITQGNTYNNINCRCIIVIDIVKD